MVFRKKRSELLYGFVDNEIHRRLAGKSKAGKVNATFLVGAVVTLIGLVITIGTYTGLINMGNYFLLAYGPILGGLAIMFGGLKRDGERVRDRDSRRNN